MNKVAREMDLRLVAAVANRVCHDVAGLSGTLDGLLALAGEDAEAACLAQETAARLVARVRLLRTAWGGDAGELDAVSIVAMAQGLPNGERLRVDCAALDHVVRGDAAQLCLCLLLVASACMPKGGTISLGGGLHGLSVAMEGGVAWPPGLIGVAPADELGPRGVAVAVCRMVAMQAGWRLVAQGARLQAVPA